MQINLASSTIQSYRDFMKTIQKALYAAWGKDKVRFTSAYPKQTDGNDIPPPIITYSILSKEPGEFKNSSEIKPRHRETITAVEDDSGNKIAIEIWGQQFDYRILFELWAEDGDKADELAEEFQRFMFQYTGYFKESGVQEILFESMQGNVGDAEWRMDLTKRNVIYYVKIDEVAGAKYPSIENIFLETEVHEAPYAMVIDILKRDGSL